MKNVAAIKKEYWKQLAKKECLLDDVSLCNKKDCLCSLVSEVHALKYVHVPRGYRNFTIRDFTGISKNGEVLLDEDTVLRIGDEISQYCWNTSFENVKIFHRKRLIEISCLMKRILSGYNIVIHGDSSFPQRSQSTGNNVFENKPAGRTLIASILTNEAIGLRVVPGGQALTYGWLDYSVLKNYLSNDDDVIREYQMCDWLVIDGISRDDFYSSLKQKNYLKSKLDPFFYERINDNKTTVIIFQFDISNYKDDIEKAHGKALHDMVFVHNPWVFSLSPIK